MKKAKGPPNLPERGEKCKMRGRKNNGGTATWSAIPATAGWAR